MDEKQPGFSETDNKDAFFEGFRVPALRFLPIRRLMPL